VTVPPPSTEAMTDGALTTGKTTLAPIYQWGGTPGTANGQFTFNIGEMRGYLGNGSTAPQAYVVFLGEAVTSGSAVTSTVAYAYSGRYESAWTATLPNGGTFTSANHNIGAPQLSASWGIECTTADVGYAVGDQLTQDGIGTIDANGYPHPTPVSFTRLVVGVTSSNNATPFNVPNKSTGGATVSLTAGRWKHRFIVQRGW
jgi:hypothetical protein